LEPHRLGTVHLVSHLSEKGLANRSGALPGRAAATRTPGEDPMSRPAVSSSTRRGPLPTDWQF